MMSIRRKVWSGVAVLGTAAALLAPTAQAALAQVGPTWTEYGNLPAWFRDSSGLQLELCLEQTTGNCLAAAPDASQPIAFPDNFPDEAFWWAAEADMPTNNGGTAQLGLATEGAFLNDIAMNQGSAFNRIRIRIDNVIRGATYKVTHPYGVETLVAQNEGPRGINITLDVGCLEAPCDYNQALRGPIGPWLTWDPNIAPAAPEGYVGDAVTPHEVVGSPFGTNVFRVEGPDVGGPGVDVIETNLFTVQGKIAVPLVRASVPGGDYNAAQSVRLITSEPTATIYYTTDGTEPTAASTPYTAPIEIVANTTLKFVAVDAAGKQSAVATETYVVDTRAPALQASPAGGTYTTAQSVSLTASEASATIYYTTDGTEPTTASTSYTAPIQVSTTQTIKAIAVDAAGNQSSTVTLAYVIRPVTTLTVGASPLTVVAGGTTTVSGKLLADNAGVAGKQVIVEARPAGAANFTALPNGQVTTAADGSYTLNVQPTRITDYQVRFAGEANGFQSSVSTIRRVTAQAAVTTRTSATSVRANGTITISGTVAPTGQRGTLTLRITRNGAVATTTTVTVANNGTYSFAYRPRTAGNYSVTATFTPRDTTVIQAGTSAPANFTVTP